VDRGLESQGVHGVADAGGKPRLARAGNSARGAVAAAGAREDAWGESSDPPHGVGGVNEAQDGVEIAPPGQEPEPLATEPEPRAFVADQWAEAAGACPAAAPVVGNDNRAGSSEDEGARSVADRTKERRLGVRDHLDTLR